MIGLLVELVRCVAYCTVDLCGVHQLHLTPHRHPNSLVGFSSCALGG